MSERPVGKTRDAGWQIGVSRTLPIDLEEAWRFLTSRQGIALWLGGGVDAPLAKGQAYESDDGTTGEIRSLRDHDRVRLTWRPARRADHAIVQVALSPTTTGTTFRFHTERLYDSEEREAMRRHWQGVIQQIEAVLRHETGPLD